MSALCGAGKIRSFIYVVKDFQISSFNKVEAFLFSFIYMSFLDLAKQFFLLFLGVFFELYSSSIFEVFALCLLLFFIIIIFLKFYLDSLFRSMECPLL